MRAHGDMPLGIVGSGPTRRAARPSSSSSSSTAPPDDDDDVVALLLEESAALRRTVADLRAEVERLRDDDQRRRSRDGRCDDPCRPACDDPCLVVDARALRRCQQHDRLRAMIALRRVSPCTRVCPVDRCDPLT
jgi:hypothetical protein